MTTVNAPLPREVVVEMARREYRMHHLLWREIRRFWHQYPRDVQEQIREMGWEPPRPARDENEAPLLDNDSGEDFLYMQRQLVRRVNRILTELDDPDYPQVEGWVQLPGPDDLDYPVPPAWFDPGSHPIVNRYLVRIKSDVVFHKHLRTWERTFTDPVFLRSVRLGRLGAMIDYYLLDPFRRRWAAAPGAMRPAVEPVDASGIGTEWDDPRYAFLSDHYAMAVNPTFWRFAGWVEDRVEEWKYANGVFGDDFWTGTWVGTLPAEVTARSIPAPTPQGTSTETEAGSDAAGSALADMEKLAGALAGTGLSCLRDVADIEPNGAVGVRVSAGAGAGPAPHRPEH